MYCKNGSKSIQLPHPSNPFGRRSDGVLMVFGRFLTFFDCFWRFLKFFCRISTFFWFSSHRRPKTDKIFPILMQRLQSTTRRRPVEDCSRRIPSDRRRESSGRRCSTSGRKLKKVKTLKLSKSDRKPSERLPNAVRTAIEKWPNGDKFPKASPTVSDASSTVSIMSKMIRNRS